MSNFFLLIYRFFHVRKIVFYLFLLVSFFFIIVFASRLKLEEDISGVTSNKKDSSPYEYVVSHSKFAEKLIINIHLSDSNQKPDPDKLKGFADQFIDSLKMRFDSSFVSGINGRIADTAINSYIDFVYDHLPIFMDECDYQRIDTALQSEFIESRLSNNYKTLLSPAGFALKNLILRDPLGIAYPVLNKMKPQEIGDNYILIDGFIFTKDRKNLLIFITPANPPSETSLNAKLLNGINDIFNKLEKVSDNRIKAIYFGSIAMANGNAEQLKKDILLTLLIALTLIFLLIGWYFRSFRIPLLGFLPALYGGGIALSILYLVKGHISAIALGVGSVILGLIIDYALYFINHYRKKGDIELTIKEMSLTIMLCSLTSAGAFLCLIFLNSSVLHDLGLFAALSVFGAALFALVILPQFLTGMKRMTEKPVRITIVDRIAAIKYEKKPVIIIFLLVAGIVSWFFIPHVGFEKNMMSLNYCTDDLRKAEQDMNRITNVSLKNVYLISTGSDLNKALLTQEKAIHKLDGLAKSGIITSYSGFGTMLISDSLQKIKIERWKKYWSQDRLVNLKTQILTSGRKFKFKESAFSSFFILLNKSYLPLDNKEWHFAINNFGKEWITTSDKMVMVSSIIKVKQENKEKVYNTFSDTPGMIIFDKQSLINRFVESVKHDFDLLVTLSMIFVTLLLLFSFGRLELGLITALPMFLSWLITLGFMGMTGIRFNIFNIIISSFIFGLGVDYSILMMRSLQYQLKYGSDESSSYKVAVILSSATTLFGVGALFLARHPALNSIAMISIVGIVFVVLISFTFQPLLFQWFILNRQLKHKPPVTANIFLKTITTWGNIIIVAIIMMITGAILKWIIPISQKKKETIFHTLFSFLSRLYIAVTFPSHRKLINEHGEDFKKPAIIIANHQSLIETPGLLRLYPKILILTTSWVWDSPIFGPTARLSSFYNVDDGVDTIIDRLKIKTEEGYSILIFPEAHRSVDHKIQRFHRGAFYLAEKLQLDIIPIIQFGTGYFLPRNAITGVYSSYCMKILERVTPDDMRFGINYSERTKQFRQYFIKLNSEFKSEMGTGDFYRMQLMLNYLFKGPILEWYFRIKMKISGNYEQFNKLIPRTGTILDIGCGYGFISYLLYLTGENRIITGIDYDAEKIAIADNGYLNNPNVRFITANISEYSFEKQDAFLLSDILHYLPSEEQEKLLIRCMENLKPGGIIVIRDADTDQQKKHKGTRFTEFLSTRIIGFNKTHDKKELFFTSKEKIVKLAALHFMETEVISESKHTSNILITIKHAGLTGK